MNGAFEPFPGPSKANNKHMLKRAIPVLVLLILGPAPACFYLLDNERKADGDGDIENRNNETVALSEDIVPKTLAFSFPIPDPDTLYYGWYNESLEDMPNEAQKHLRKIRIDEAEALKHLQRVNETYFPYFENGEIHLPKKYDVEKKYSINDRKKLNAALKVAYRYANINKAFEDGYRLMPRFMGGMGIHMINIDYLMSDEVDIEKPEFLAYVKSRKTERFMLSSIGYIHVLDEKKKRYKVFDSKEARGHFRLVKRCIRIERNIYAPVKFFDGHCDEESGDYFVGDKWMMHVAVNFYNEDGIFADNSPIVNYLSLTDTVYSFYGKKIER